MYFSVYAIFSAFSIGTSLAALPSYIKPCSSTDRSCFVQHGNEALPSLLQGDKTLNLPELNPLRIEKVDANAGNLKLTFKNVNIFGLDTLKVVDMDADFGQHKIYLELDAETVNLIGDYTIDGNIMVLPVKGDGPCNITLKNANFKYTLFYKIELKGGLQFSVVESNDKLEWKIQKAYFKFDNLFNGNKAMGDNVNNFLNENDQEVLKEVGGAVTGIIKVVANKVYSAILGNIPLEELFIMS